MSRAGSFSQPSRIGSMNMGRRNAPMTGAGRPPGTATRLSTGMAGHRESVAGGGVALNAAVNVTDRPMTQQGLGGMKTGLSRGPQRQVQDKTFWLGMLRTRIGELQQEITNLKAESRNASDDQSTFLSYEKRAELVANEIKHLQNQMGDYNTLVDKLTTDESISDIQMDFEDLRSQNDRTAQGLDTLFEEKQRREDTIKSFELELQEEKSMTDTMISDMDPKTRQRYMELQNMNDRLLKQLERGQQELDALNNRKQELDEELAASPVKQEAVRHYEQLSALEEKRDVLVEEQNARGSPQEERERLLKQVKEDNQEIAVMERQTNEIRDKLGGYGEEVTQLNMDIEENQGERNQKYKELKKREETMNDFMDTYDEVHAKEFEAIGEHERNITLLLEQMSRNVKREDLQEGSQHHVPTPQEFNTMKDDLHTKESEMNKSKSTASGLVGEHEKLHQDLMKVEQLESKITTELSMLRERIEKMTSELAMYEDLDNLRTAGEKKKKQLGESKVLFHRRKANFKLITTKITADFEALKSQLGENETFAQLGNLERKWQHHEQNNYVMIEFIASKQMECDYLRVAKKVNCAIVQYNADLQTKVAKAAAY